MVKASIAMALAALITGCGLFNRAETYRYRITVEVDTPQGLRSGSSVWETSASESSGIPDRGIRSRMRGEAVAVDLPEGTLFALMRRQDMSSDYGSGLVPGHLKAYPQAGAPMVKDWKEYRRIIASTKPAFELYSEEFPLLVRFRDINDPASVEKVDPAALAASFGPGITLRRIVVTVTDDDVTEGIEKRFIWWTKYRKRRFDGTSTVTENMRNTQLAAHLSSGGFSTEFNR